MICSRITNFCGLPVAVIGNSGHEADVPRHLVVGDLSLTEEAYVFRRRRLAGLEHDERADLLAEALIGHAEDLGGLNLRMADQKFLDLARVDVFAAADEHVLEAADDAAIALLVDGREIARMHPARGIDRLGRAFAIFPVAAHHAVAAGAQFAGGSERYDVARRVHDLDLDVRMDAADGRDPPLERVVGARLERDRARFRHAVADGDLAHMHALRYLAHRLDRARRARHDAGAERGQVVAREIRMLELGDEHRRHAVERRAAVARDGGQRRLGVEAFAGKHHGGADGCTAQHAEHHAEAVVERHRNAKPVLGGERH